MDTANLLKSRITGYNKYILILLPLAISLNCLAQANISPAKPQDTRTVIMGAKLHIGNGQVVETGYLIFDKGKITGVGDATVARIDLTGAIVITANGKQVYPGFIAPVTNLGLVEISSVKATLDYNEIGELNPHIRALVAYNTDSKVPATIRSNDSKPPAPNCGVRLFLSPGSGLPAPGLQGSYLLLLYSPHLPAHRAAMSLSCLISEYSAYVLHC